MKKKLFLLLIVVLFSPQIIFAKNVDGIACEYVIKCKDGYSTTSYQISKLKIMISGYNNNNNGAGFSSSNPPSGVAAFIQKKGSESYVEVGLDSKIKDYYYKDVLENYQDLNLYILQADSEGFNFAYQYNLNGKCPTLYCNNGGSYYIESVSYDYNNNDFLVETLNPVQEYLKDNSVGEWQTKEDFYEDANIKEPRVCRYNNIQVLGDYYDGGLKFEKNLYLEFITNYDIDGSIRSYDINFDGKHLMTPIKNLNNNVNESLDMYSAITISSKQLKEIFNNECGKTIYVYLSDVAFSIYTYTITTDRNEADSNVINENYPSNYPTTPSTPSINNDYTTNINYNNICGDPRISNIMQIIGYIIFVVKILVPLIIIVLGMMDFGKAVISSDEKNINKAASSLIRRIIAGLAIFFIPTIIFAILNLTEVSNENNKQGSFVGCTKCMFDPINSCGTSSGGNGGSGGAGKVNTTHSTNAAL